MLFQLGINASNGHPCTSQLNTNHGDNIMSLFASKEEKQARREAEERAERERQERDAQREKLVLQIDQLKSDKVAAEQQLEKLREAFKPEFSAYCAEKAPKWEYCRGVDITEPMIDLMGQQGWELVGLTSFETGSGGVMTVQMLYTFKRPVPDIPEKLTKKYQPILELNQRVDAYGPQIEDLESQLKSL
jgi:hypothetical protein